MASNNEKIKLLTNQTLLKLPKIITHYVKHRTVSGNQPRAINNAVNQLKYFFDWYGLTEHATLADIRKIQVNDINDYIYYLQTTHLSKSGRPLAKSSIEAYLNGLRSFFHWLSEDSTDPDNYPYPYVDFNPMTRVRFHVEKPTAQSRAKSISPMLYKGDMKRDFLYWLSNTYKPALKPQAKALYERTEARNYAIIALLFASGLRVTELVNINVEDVDLENKLIRNVVRKGGFKDVARFSGWAVPYLENWLQDRNLLIIPDDNHAFFIAIKSQDAFRISQTQVERMFKKLTTAYGHPSTPHKARHTFGTELYDATKDVVSVQNALGQTTDSATKVYIHGNQQELDQAIDKL